MNHDDIVHRLEELADPDKAAGMARFGIRAAQVYGVSMPELNRLAKQVIKAQGRDHGLAAHLWETPCRETRILAGLIDDPQQVDDGQMEAWAADFDSWEICDQVCIKLFRKTALAWDKAREWSRRDEKFVARAGFALMATLAVHAKKTPDDDFLCLLDLIKQRSTDSRPMVKKAVNWALRQIGKRSLYLHGPALALAEELAASDDMTARWIGKDAAKELTSPKILARLKG